MDTTLLFDIDGTLTPPRQPLRLEMADALKKLKVPFHVAAGSDLVLVEPQFLRPLWEFGLRRDFEAFVSNGATHLHCPFSQRFATEFVREFNFEKHLGRQNYSLLIDALQAVLESPEFQLPHSVKIIGDRITNRNSMLNFAPIGRPKGEVTPEGKANRESFVQFDRATKYRRRIREYLNKALSEIIREKQLRIMLGGETSFDIVIEGQDKTNAARTLLTRGYQRVIFFGDALFEGGNDSVITDCIKNWPTGDCPLSAIPVNGWQDTIRILHERGWINP
jgi:phosphomannomutase